MEVGGLDPSEFGDWQEPAPSDEEEEAGEVEDGKESEDGKGGDGRSGSQVLDSDSSGDGDTACEAEGDGVGAPRVVLPSYMAGHTDTSHRTVDRAGS